MKTAKNIVNDNYFIVIIGGYLLFITYNTNTNTSYDY